MLRPKVLGSAAAFVAALLAVAGPAWAYIDITSSSVSPTVSAYTMSGPTSVTVTSISGVATLNWTAPTTPSGASFTYTVARSGGTGNMAGGCAATSISTTTCQDSTATPGQTYTWTVSAHLGQWKSPTGQVTATAAGATSNFLVQAPSIETAGTVFTVTVTARDSLNDTVTGYTGTISFSSADAQASLPGNYTFTTGSGRDNGTHTFTNAITLKTAGSQSVTATDTATITGSASVTIDHAAAAKLAFVTAAQTFDASTGAAAGSGAMTVQVQDAFGNPVEETTATTVTLTSNVGNSSQSVFNTAYGQSSTNTVQIAAGSSRATFYFSTINNGCMNSGCPVTITAAITGLTSGTQAETVNKSASSNIAVTVGGETGTTPAPNGSVTYTIQVNNNNSTGTSDFKITNISGLPPGASFSGPTCVAIAHGSSHTWTVTVTTTTATPAGTSSFVALATQYSSSSNTCVTAGATGQGVGTLTVNPSSASTMAIASSPISTAHNSRSGPIIIQLQDQYGNAVAPASPLTVNLSSSSAGGTFYIVASGGSATTSVTITSSSTFVTVYYQDTTAGTPIITAQTTGDGSATQIETVS